MKPGTEAWVQLAEVDFRTAVGVLTLPTPIPESACCHAQQCVEKYLKAVLEESGRPVLRTHDLGALLVLAIGGVPGLASYLDAIEALVPYAVELHYPHDRDLFGDLNEAAERAVDTMTAVRSTVRAAFGASDEPRGGV